jgi:hypothetical protein
MYIRIQYKKKIDIGIQYQKQKRLGLYLLHHFTEFCSMKCKKRIQYIYPILVCRGQTGNIAWGCTYFIILLSFCGIKCEKRV